MRSLLCLSVALVCSVATADHQYELVDSSGAVRGQVEVGRGRLVVFQNGGQRTFFSRQSSYDSVDRLFVGYLNLKLNRVLRFPRSGRGYLQTADLDDLSPRFRNSQYAVRRSRSIAGPGTALPPVGYVSPMISSGFRGNQYGRGYASPLPQSVMIDSKTIPNPALPPARVLFRNDGPREIQVGVVDLIDRSRTRSMRIRPGIGVEVELIRDAGAKRVSLYQVVTPLGDSMTREMVSEIPPPIRYEVVVHEWAVQSVAIDRTGKSPNLIEDINFQGRGIGRFPLPPGAQLQSGTIDVYRAAKSRGNQGSIAPIVPNQESAGDNASALDRAILEAQRDAQRGR